jgi:hypothetical protein
VKVALDLGGVTYIESSGVGMLAAKLKTLRERGGDMKLLHLSRRAASLLGIRARRSRARYSSRPLVVSSYSVRGGPPGSLDVSRTRRRRASAIDFNA